MREYALKAKLIKDNTWVKGSYFCDEGKHYLITSINPFMAEEIVFETLSAPAQIREVNVEESKYEKDIYENDIVEFYIDRVCEYSKQSKYDGKVLIRGVVHYNKYSGGFDIRTDNHYNRKIFKARGREYYNRFLPSWVSLPYSFEYHHKDEADKNKIPSRNNRPHLRYWHHLKVIGNIFDDTNLLKEEPIL